MTDITITEADERAVQREQALRILNLERENTVLKRHLSEAMHENTALRKAWADAKQAARPLEETPT